MAVGHMLTIQNKGVVLYNKCLFAQCKIRLVIDYEMEGYEGHVKCCIECILMEVMMLSMEYSATNQRESVCNNYSFTTPIYAQIGVRSAVITRSHMAYTHTLLGYTSLTQFCCSFLVALDLLAFIPHFSFAVTI
jgi:hypothetical protein